MKNGRSNPNATLFHQAFQLTPSRARPAADSTTGTTSEPKGSIGYIHRKWRTCVYCLCVLHIHALISMHIFWARCVCINIYYYLLIHLFIHVFVFLFIYLFIYVFFFYCVVIYLFIYAFLNLFIFSLIWFIHLFLYVYILYIWLHVYIFIFKYKYIYI